MTSEAPAKSVPRRGHGGNPRSLANLKPDPAKGNAGGARKNAGRPKGALSKLTKENVERAKAGGIMPLDYMLKIMRDRKQKKERRDWAAEKAAPFVHPRIAAIEHSGNVQLTHEQALEQLARDEEDEDK